LLKNRENLKSLEQRQHLKDLLALNETISTVMILKEKLKHIWTYRSRAWAEKALNHDYAIHNGKIEGVNNKIKVIKRKAYGFHDLRYFTLKIYQAFYN